MQLKIQAVKNFTFQVYRITPPLPSFRIFSIFPKKRGGTAKKKAVAYFLHAYFWVMHFWQIRFEWARSERPINPFLLPIISRQSPQSLKTNDDLLSGRRRTDAASHSFFPVCFIVSSPFGDAALHSLHSAQLHRCSPPRCTFCGAALPLPSAKDWLYVELTSGHAATPRHLQSFRVYRAIHVAGEALQCCPQDPLLLFITYRFQLIRNFPSTCKECWTSIINHESRKTIYFKTQNKNPFSNNDENSFCLGNTSYTHFWVKVKEDNVVFS